MTLTEIARLAGVSTASASNALTGKGRMSVELRQRILNLAAESGYTLPDSSRRQARRRILVLCEHIGITFCDKIVEGISEAAIQYDVAAPVISLSLLSRQPNMNPDGNALAGYIRDVIESIGQSYLGIVYVSHYPRNITGLFPSLSCPVVYTYAYTNDTSCTVNYDDEQGSYLATEHLIQSGRRRIAVISGPINSTPMSNRMTGYQRALIDNGSCFDPSLLRVGNWYSESGYSLMIDLINQPEPPDAVFAQNDTMASGALRAIRERGLSLPDDIALIGFDDEEIAAHTYPQLSSVHAPLHEIGRSALEMILMILDRKTLENRKIKLPCSLVARGSTLRTAP